MLDGLKFTLRSRALPPATELGPLKTKTLELEEESASVQFDTPSPGYKGSWQETAAEAGTLVCVPNDSEHDVDALVWAFPETGNAISRNACTHRALRRIANEEDRTPEEGNMGTSQAARICNAHPGNPGGVTGQDLGRSQLQRAHDRH